jgi:hypothetical protein
MFLLSRFIFAVSEQEDSRLDIDSVDAMAVVTSVRHSLSCPGNRIMICFSIMQQIHNFQQIILLRSTLLQTSDMYDCLRLHERQSARDYM